MTASEITTVGSLRAAIKDLDDEALVMAQVAAADGSAWNTHCKFAGPDGQRRFVVLTLWHPDLATLPRWRHFFVYIARGGW